jgi:hypothetical protein
MKYKYLLTLPNVFLSFVAYAGFEEQCSLQYAPEDAKVTRTHGVDFFSYPVEQPMDYTGCSYIWLEDGTKLFSSYYTNGSLVWLRGKEPKAKEESICFYESGDLIERKSQNSSHCPTP